MLYIPTAHTVKLKESGPYSFTTSRFLQIVDPSFTGRTTFAKAVQLGQGRTANIISN